MSITITCEFDSRNQADAAAQRLRRRGYMVSNRTKRRPAQDPLLVAYPYGTAGGSTPGNSLMAALPPMAGNGILLHVPEKSGRPLLSVLTDDTRASEARLLVEALGGRIIS